MTGEAVPVLTFEQAERVGEALHDHIVRLAGSSPFPRGDLALADTVQFVTRKARELTERKDR